MSSPAHPARYLRHTSRLDWSYCSGGDGRISGLSRWGGRTVSRRRLARQVWAATASVVAATATSLLVNVTSSFGVTWSVIAGLGTACVVQIVVQVFIWRLGPTELEVDREGLKIANEWPHQSTFALHAKPTADVASEIRWRAVMSVANHAHRPIIIHDIRLDLPAVKSDGAVWELVRVRAAHTMTLYGSRTEYMEIQQIDGNAGVREREKRAVVRPVALKPGDRAILVYEQAFQLRRNGAPVGIPLADRAALAGALAPVLGLQRTPQGVRCALGRRINTVITTPNGEFRREIAYVILVEGCTLYVPSPDEVRALREREDDPLGDGGQPDPDWVAP